MRLRSFARRSAVAVVFAAGVAGSVASEPSDEGFVDDVPVEARPVSLSFGLDAARPAVRFAVVVDDSDVDFSSGATVGADVSARADADVAVTTFEVGFDVPDGSGDIPLSAQAFGDVASYFAGGAGDLVVRRSDPEGAGVVNVDVVVNASVFVPAGSDDDGVPVLSVEPEPD